jgi:hypothetical protein
MDCCVISQTTEFIITTAVDSKILQDFLCYREASANPFTVYFRAIFPKLMQI